jgi:general transcription factor 3C polypeptide 5 (transcription factor C subunit 1)
MSSPLPSPEQVLRSFERTAEDEEPQTQDVDSVDSQPPPQAFTPNAAPPSSRLPTYYSVEYPGYVQPQPSSLVYALRTLGGQKALKNAFSEGGRILELKLQPDNPFAHPVTGDVVNTNKLLVKVVTRRKKGNVPNPSTGPRVNTNELGGMSTDKGKGKEVQPEEGTYSAEIVGVIPKTIRFRSASYVC